MTKRQKVTITIVTIILLMFLLIIILVMLLFHSYLMKIDYDYVISQEEMVESTLSDEEILQELLEDELGSDEEDSPKEEIELLEVQLTQNQQENQNSSDVFNILVIGCDSRKKDGVGRSDTMILLSVSETSETIHMTSIMRDCYVTIPGKGNNRINAAYAYGGGSLLLETIENNFAVDVDKYVAFDFYSFVEIVDSIGGIELEIEDDEIPVLNSYIKGLNRLNGRSEDTFYLTTSGLQHLNGTQALGYARIRYVGDGDFERTSRQRAVMTKVFEKAKTLNLLEINELLNIVLPKVKTNLTQQEVVSLLLKILEYLQYDLDSHRLPVDGSWKYMRVNGMSVLGIDLEENQKALEAYIAQ